MEVDNDQLRAIVEADTLTTTQEVAEELNIDLLVNQSSMLNDGPSAFLKQIGKVKKLNKWMPYKLTPQKIMFFEVPFSLILHVNKPFLNWIVMYNKK